MMRKSIFIILLTIVQLSVSFDVKKGYFWQVTDFHYDANYSIHGDSNKMCHQMVHDNRKELSNYGNYLCDAPWALIKSAVNAMKTIHDNPDFILWTGDSIPHVSNSDLSTKKVYENIGNVTRLLRETFGNTSIYPVLGNHDEYPADAFPPGTTDYYQKILTEAEFDTLLSSDAAQQFTKGGYYTTLTKTGLRIIGLNTNLYYSQNKLTGQAEDPAEQFKWLRKELIQARISNEKVMLLAHIAPGLFEKKSGLMWFYSRFNQKYVDILRNFSDVIATQVYGHEHTDSFRILSDTYGMPVSILFLSPAVTPWKSTLPGVGANNPGIRLYTYNQLNGEVMSYKQYFLNLSATIKTGIDKWTLEYDTHENYGVKILTPQSLSDLVQLFLSQDNNAFFNQYLTYNSVSKDTNPPCNVSCQRIHYCTIIEFDQSEFNQCLMGFQTTASPERTTHNHHPHKPVPHYYIYIIGGLGGLVFILFIIVAILCIKRRKHLIPHRYSKFSNTLKSGPIN